MPHAYEAMRDKFKQQGSSDSAAKTKAAKIYNARRKPGTPPVTNKPDPVEAAISRLAKKGT